MNTIKPSPIRAELAAELTQFEQAIHALEHGGRDPDEFKRFRLENGVYGIRQSSDRYMVRVKIPLGLLTAEQLETLADVAEHHTPLKIGHITTRQDVQFHHVIQSHLTVVLRKLAESGLTTREACGNTVRNVTGCPWAGVAPGEPFDVTPYALAVSRCFLRNPINQNMPRKFKIAFEGCPTDHARIPIHDLGCVAAVRGEDGKAVRGFRLYVGGGLGPTPQSALLLEEFMPAEWLMPSVEAALRLFDRHGNRQDRNRARLKFLVKDWGIEEFRTRWLAERKIAWGTRSGGANWEVPAVEETAPPAPSIPPVAEPLSQEWQRWRATNCLAQRQPGYFAVSIRCPLGDVSVPQMRGLAELARGYCGGRIRTTITQNFLLRWVPASHLANLYSGLEALGLAQRDADHLPDITRCPAADTCQLGITHTRGLASALGERLTNGLASDSALENLSIKISGCPNSCGHHHIADIGLYGNVRTIEGHSVGHYRLLLGGKTSIDKAVFGRGIATLPAKRVADAVNTLLEHYRGMRQDQESFHDFVERLGVPHFKQLLGPFATLPPYRERPDLYGDLGVEGEFQVKLGKGECAA